MNGLYKKARQGILRNFTGIDDPYEAPTNPDLKIETSRDTIDQCVQQVIDGMVANSIIEDTTVKRVSPCLVHPMTIDEANELSELGVLQLNEEQS